MSTRRDTYHHGNLRAELIRCGKELLASEGIQNLTLRAVTRAAGVSHGAPRNEFADMNGLLAAMAVEGFEELIALREQALARQSDPARRLQAVLGCYVDFAAAHPGLFWLMYGPHIREREQYPDLLAAARRSYGLLEATVFGFLEAAGLAHARTSELVQCAWSAVHGMAMLFNGRPLGPSIPAAMSFAKWKASVIEFAMAGLVARAGQLAR
ncbi:TetR/AcrR family transcriptional regulator [Piscinibacter sakaiensis]|uniref:Transcriptional regulator, TetR family n=1 Tax=Piscinibacter sakaiensis TaxID=1547922 RepID=A0A0K8P294_PISS1|nr:TetR/AcrR family transcriptional regulator [Piscinibacter sakaiensis]GAP36738.1 transcriptional regulator, TetR family [Piscinibacter sakaiensis]